MSCLFLFTRDFRLVDNKTLQLVKDRGYQNIIPIFIFTPEQFNKEVNQYRSDNSLQLMLEGLESLDQSMSGKLNYYHGETETIINHILDHNSDITAIASNLDITPFGKIRHKLLKKIAKSRNQVAYLTRCDYNLLPFDEITTAAGTFYKTFTHFKNKVYQRSQEICQQLTGDLTNEFNYQKITGSGQDGVSDDVDENMTYATSFLDMDSKVVKNKNNIFTSPERNQFNRDYFLNHKLSDENLDYFHDYETFRTYPKYDTTLFSAYMKYGLVSCREVYQRIYQYYQKTETELLRQLIWREYYYYLMEHLPSKQTIGGGNMQEKEYPWENNEDYFQKWKTGMTGFPFIDACMRQMNKTGWMHNRSRLCSANALVYLFLNDWKRGEQYFAEKLADYDISQNNGNWQWCGGVGVDRKPYLRMYNPYTLSEKYDKEGEYVKKWVPELKDVSNNDLLKYDKYLASHGYSEGDGKLINGYPTPCCNYKQAREKAKQFF